MKRVYVVDPSLFTIPYDVALTNGLVDIGLTVEFYGRKLRVGEVLGPIRFPFNPFFYHRTDQLRLPNTVRLAAKSTEYGVDALRFLMHVRHNKPDIVHFQWSAIPLLDAWIFTALRKMTKVVLTVHDSEPFNGKASSSAQMLGYDRLLRSAHALIVHTVEAKRKLAQRGIAAGRISVVGHGILGGEASTGHADRSTDIAGRKIRILLFGRLKEYKGIDILVEALGQLPEVIRAKMEVVIAGEPFFDIGPIKSRIVELRLSECLDIREGYVSEKAVSSLIHWADILIFPYRQIDASGVLFMSLNYRKPVIASKLGGFVDVVEKYGNGLLINPGAVNELRNVLEQVANDPAIVKDLTTKAEAIELDSFSWTSIARATNNVYAAIQ